MSTEEKRKEEQVLSDGNARSKLLDRIEVEQRLRLNTWYHVLEGHGKTPLPLGPPPANIPNNDYEWEVD